MRAGAAEYLPRPIASEDVEAAFSRVRRRLAPAAAESPLPASTVSAFFSAKGGTGVTTIATNVAVALREITGLETLLIDFSSLGTGALQLGLQPRYSYLDVIQNFHRIDSELFRSFLEVHETGLSVLASSPFGDEEEPYGADQVVGVLRLSRRHFPHIVVDAGNRLSGPAFTALMESDNRLVVANADLPTLRNVRRVIEVLVRHNGKAPPKVVLNRFDPEAGLTLRDVQQALKQDVEYTIDEDLLTVREAGNLGRPAVLDRRTGFSRRVMEIGSEIAGPDYSIRTPDNLLRSLLRPLSRRNQKEA
jgi:pilus assembly protein CpaE